MPTIQSIERKIERVERFAVKILYPNGRDIRGDQAEFQHTYNYERAASGDMTVSQWKETRFRNEFQGFKVDVLLGNGRAANGNTKLANVRDSY
ncbi:MAG TPA: hypothetical protein VGB61_01150 [Pyrinomonadaceae bacterium]